MNAVEFAEKIVGIELLEYQKELIRRFEKLPRDCVIISRRGYMIVVPRKEIKNEHTI